MHRHLLVVALGLGCLPIWVTPPAAARAATVTTASGAPATAAGSGTAPAFSGDFSVRERFRKQPAIACEQIGIFRARS